MKKLNVLFLEPFLGGSHKAFLQGLEEYSSHIILPITMSDKHVQWRMVGGAVTLAEKVSGIEENIDVVVASSLTNLTAFIALTNPRFARVPIILYMHENQLTEPLENGQTRDKTLAYLNFLSALVADKVIFSSEFHRQSFLTALPDFLKQFPDYSQKHSVDSISNKSIVIHPGIHLNHFNSQPDTRSRNTVPVIVWNQRWSFDKDPARFFRVMNRLDDAGFDFELILAGDNRHDKPEEFERAWSRYGRRIIHYGYVENLDDYRKLLHKGDIVVSTAIYEYFCVAIMEAVFCGCHPILPNGLTYRELIPPSLRQPLLHAPVFYNTEDDLFLILRGILAGETKPLPKPTLQNINKHLDWSRQIMAFDRLFETVVQSKNQD